MAISSDSTIIMHGSMFNFYSLLQRQQKSKSKHTNCPILKDSLRLHKVSAFFYKHHQTCPWAMSSIQSNMVKLQYQTQSLDRRGAVSRVKILFPNLIQTLPTLCHNHMAWEPDTSCTIPYYFTMGMAWSRHPWLFHQQLTCCYNSQDGIKPDLRMLMACNGN